VVSVIRAGNWQFSANRASVNLKTPFPVTGMGFEEYQKKDSSQLCGKLSDYLRE
jgi:hypothetical protein